jgi:hypothetical protein
MENKSMFPTEEVTLPSKGLLYPLDNPLAKGSVEMKYMTAREEDILTNESYIKKGIVIDKLLQSLIISPINYDDLAIGDKNALLIAARVLGYGKDYSFTIENNKGEKIEHTVDLTALEDKLLNEEHLLKPNHNEFSFTLPILKKTVTFKILTTHDEKKIESELKGLRKSTKEVGELTTRLKHIILSVDGDYEIATVRNFVDNQLLARDSRALREYMKQISPDVNMTFDYEDENGEMQRGVNVPLNVNFFWPDA